MTKGQQAMAMAMIYPQPDRGRGKTDDAKKGAETASFSYRRVQEARSVLRHSRALAEDVLANRDVTLDEALDRVRREQERSSSQEAMLAELRQHAPELAELVEDERLSLKEAYAAFKQRQDDAAKAEANKREGMLRLSQGGTKTCLLKPRTRLTNADRLPSTSIRP